MTEDKLYSAIETAIIRWNLDGTKTKICPGNFLGSCRKTAKKYCRKTDK